MWGAKPGLNLDFANILMKRLIHGSIEMRESHGKGLDQLLLGRYIFPFLDGKFYQVVPLAKFFCLWNYSTVFFENFILGRVLAHDSYNCGFLNINKTKGFPTQRLEEPPNFVGSNSGKMGSPMLEVCPPPCRPFDHKDWIYCWQFSW